MVYGALFVMLVVLLAAVSRVYVPWAPPRHGIVLRRFPVPLPARLRRLAVPTLMASGVAAANGWGGWLPIWAPLLVMAFVIALAVVPQNYVITDQGIGVGRTVYRRWTEFSGLSVRRGRIRLKPISGIKELRIWLPGRFQDAETVTEVRALMRAAYKGQSSSARAAVDATGGEDPAAGQWVVA